MITADDISHHSFYLMRHAQSTGNVGRKRHKASPAYPLTFRGLGQAFLRSDLLPLLNPRPEVFVSSTMERAVESTIMLTGHEPSKRNQEDGLNEWDPNESEEELCERAMGVLQRRVKQGGKTHFFVTHSWTIDSILEAFGICDLDDHISLTAVYRFDPPKEEGGKWKVYRITPEKGHVKETQLKEFEFSEREHQLFEDFIKHGQLDTQHKRTLSLLDRYLRPNGEVQER